MAPTILLIRFFFLYAPLLVIMSVGAGVSEVIIMPLMHRAKTYDCVDSVKKFILSRTIVFMLLLSPFVLLSISILDDKQDLFLVSLMIPIPVLAVLASIHGGILNSEGKFYLAVLGPLYGSCMAIPVLLILPVTQYSLAISLFLFEMGRWLGLRIHMSRTRNQSDSQHGVPKELFQWAIKGGGYQVVGSFLVAMNPFIDVLFAKFLGAGAVSSVEYVNRLWNIVPLFFTGSITLIYSHVSIAASKGSLILGK